MRGSHEVERSGSTRRWLSTWLGLVLGVGLLGGGPNAPGATISVCDFASLEEAVAAGGEVRLGCSGRIAFPRPLQIFANTTLDATGSEVVFDGQGRTRLFEVTTNARLTLIQLRLESGLRVGARTNRLEAASGQGGAVWVDHGSLVASNCIFATNVARGGTVPSTILPGSISGGAGQGGAVFAQASTLEFRNCSFVGNRAVGPSSEDLGASPVQSRSGVMGSAFGGAVCLVEGGSLRAEHTQFHGNVASGGESQITFGDGGSGRGGALYVVATRWIAADCEFLDNRATGGSGVRNSTAGNAAGGAVCLDSAATEGVIENSFLARNSARPGRAWNTGDGAGGAIYAAGPLVCRGTRFDQNIVYGSTGVDALGPARGGGIWAGGATEIVDCFLAGNSAEGVSPTYWGGPLSARSSTGMGGGLYARGKLRVANSTFAKNLAQGGPGLEPLPPGGDAGHGWGGGLFVAGEATLVNSTFWRNLALGGSGPLAPGNGLGGAIFVGPGSLTGTNLTLRWNEVEGGTGFERTSFPPLPLLGAAVGGGLYMTNRTSTRLYNSILAHYLVSENCAGTLADSDHNLSSDRSCHFETTAGWDEVDPQFGALDFYGGPTPTMPLSSASPALDAANPERCPATDQRGVSRPFGFGCDLGAFELEARLTLEGSRSDGGRLQLRFVGPPERAFVLQTSLDLKAWRAVETNRTDGAGRLVFDPLAPGTNRHGFYRTRQLDP